MSIKTIGQQTQSNTSGLKKIINKGAQRLVIDVLQSTQYSTPIPSTIRELVTNACDSQREKEIAVEILTGKAKVEDYFITRQGEEYTDSNFDSSYYSLENLNTAQNNVKVKYHENDAGTGFCDTVEIIDYGVGIGNRRLEGMLELGYSTKRNTSENFGAFGLGSKIALSTGVSHYTIETVHNNKKFKMHCYPYKTDFVITKWDCDGHVVLSNGEHAYYKKTTSTNYTKISFGSKKHNRSAYKNAIKEQLSYISNVDYYTLYLDGEGKSREYKEDINKEVLVNTPSCIVAAGSRWYSKPHIVIVKNPGDSVGINYGSIDFRELEMEDLAGNIGIKCPMRQSYINDDGQEVVLQEGVDVTPSREKVIWNESTKEYVQKMLEQAAEEAADVIQEALKEDDFIQWIKLCTNILYKNPSGEGLGDDLVGLNQIARMVDTSKIRPMFKSSGIRFTNPKKMFAGYSVRQIRRVGNSIERTELNDWTSADMSRVYVADEGGAVKINDLYLTIGDSRSFILISPRGTDYLSDDIARETRPEIIQKLKAEKNKYEQNKQIITSLLNTQTSSVHSYSDIEVPADALSTIQDIESRDVTPELTPAELRKLQQKTVGYSLRRPWNDDKWIWDKVEPTIETVVNSKIETYYGTSEDGPKIKLAAEMLRKRVPHWGEVSANLMGTHWERSPILFREAIPSSADTYRKQDFTLVMDKYETEAPQLIRLSESNCKYARKNANWKHIDDFFFTMSEEGAITASKYLKPVLTCISLRDKKQEWSWLGNFTAKSLLPPAHALYKTVHRYSEFCYPINLCSSELEVDDFVRYLVNFIQYQDICDTDDLSLKQEKSREFFVVDVPSIDAYDKEIAEIGSVLDDLSEHIGNWMLHSRDTGYSNAQHDSIYNVVFNHYNKFDIEIPEIEVPGLRFNLTPRS